MSENPLFVFVGDYENVDDAKADLEVLRELHSEHAVGTYDAAIVTKTEEGKVKIVDKIEKPTQHGGWAGLAVGAVLGFLGFIWPSVLVGGLVGAGVGALIGHFEGGMSRGPQGDRRDARRERGGSDSGGGGDDRAGGRGGDQAQEEDSEEGGQGRG